MLSTTKHIKKGIKFPEVRESQELVIKKEVKKGEPIKILTTKKISVSIDSDDDKVDANVLSEFLENDTDRNKNKTATEIQELGEKLIQEIEGKKYLETIKKYKYIPFILKHTKGIYSAEELLKYSLNDVKVIYSETKEAKKSKSWIARFFRFLFNI